MNLTLGIFIVILLITLCITYWAARRTHTTSDFYAADSQANAAQNGFAPAGDCAVPRPSLPLTGLTALLRHGWRSLCAWPAGRLLHGIASDRRADAQ